MSSPFSPVSVHSHDVEDIDLDLMAYQKEMADQSRFLLDEEKTDDVIRQEDRERHESPLGSSERRQRSSRLNEVGFLPELQKVFHKRGFTNYRILQHWKDIVGEKLSYVTQPVALVRRKGGEGTLRIQVTPAAAFEIHHRQQLIIEKVNTYFGEICVARLSLEQTPHLNKKTLPRFVEDNTPTPPAVHRYLEIKTQKIQHQGLREALIGLGASILKDKKVDHLFDEWDEESESEG